MTSWLHINLHSVALAKYISLEKTAEGGRKFNPNVFQICLKLLFFLKKLIHDVNCLKYVYVIFRCHSDLCIPAHIKDNSKLFVKYKLTLFKNNLVFLELHYFSSKTARPSFISSTKSVLQKLQKIIVIQKTSANKLEICCLC